MFIVIIFPNSILLCLTYSTTSILIHCAFLFTTFKKLSVSQILEAVFLQKNTFESERGMLDSTSTCA